MNERAKEYSEGDDQFAQWLFEVDVIIEGTIGLSLFDLEDLMIRDAYDARETPENFIKGTVADAVEENYGAGHADFLRQECSREPGMSCREIRFDLVPLPGLIPPLLPGSISGPGLLSGPPNLVTNDRKATTLRSLTELECKAAACQLPKAKALGLGMRLPT